MHPVINAGVCGLLIGSVLHDTYSLVGPAVVWHMGAGLYSSLTEKSDFGVNFDLARDSCGNRPLDMDRQQSVAQGRHR